MLSTTVCSEVLKLPILIEHYMEYEGDFVDFMIHHYGGHEKDADWETDQKLPFIKISQNLSIDFSLPSRNSSRKRKSTSKLCRSEDLTYIKNLIEIML
jgi:hypothetical protein